MIPSIRIKGDPSITEVFGRKDRTYSGGKVNIPVI
jgi:hypothetical protein